MGGRKQDNFILVSVYEDKSVAFELIFLNENKSESPVKLEDYILPD